jgi:hypothetical protein
MGVAFTTPEENLEFPCNEESRWSMPPSMEITTFESFDPSFYLRIGRLDVVEALALGRALLELCPKDQSPQLDRIAVRLERLVSEGETMLTVRRRETAPVDHSADLLLDALADSLWGTLRDRLDGWGVFEHVAMKDLLPARQRSSAAAALAQARRKAARARDLAGRLFGAEGLAFIRLPYPAQARSMASILRLIEEDGLRPTIDELAGPELMVALIACQAQYEAMVKSRMSRSGRKSAHFGWLGGKLRRLLARYINAVLTLLDEDEPESLDLVVGALQPVAVLRSHARRGATSPAAAPVDPADNDASDDVPAVA